MLFKSPVPPAFSADMIKVKSCGRTLENMLMIHFHLQVLITSATLSTGTLTVKDRPTLTSPPPSRDTVTSLRATAA